MLIVLLRISEAGARENKCRGLRPVAILKHGDSSLQTKEVAMRDETELLASKTRELGMCAQERGGMSALC